MSDLPEKPDEKKRDHRHTRMLVALSQGMTWEEAGKYVGVDESTLRRWVRNDPELAHEAIKARSTADDMVEAMVFKNCLDPDAAHNVLRMFWLKSRRAATYRETTKQFIDDARKEYDTTNSPDDL